MRQLAMGSVLFLACAALGAAPRLPAFVDDVAMVTTDGEGAKYWPRWRGPSGQGHATGTGYVASWSDTQNVLWKMAVPGLGHSSPIVWKDHIFLTTGRDGGAKLSMLAYRRSDGKLLWETTVPTAGIEHLYPKNSPASATPTTDGERIYASFGAQGLVAFDFDGQIIWHRKIGELNNVHGSAGSPVLYKDRLFIYQDHQGSSTLGSFVAAFSTKTGETIWWKDRVETTGWGTPIVLRTSTRDEVIVSGQRKVYSYDPNTGAELWTVRGNNYEVIPTPVVGHGFVFCSSGRQGPTIAIKPGGAGDVTATHVGWSSPKGSPFVPSALLHGELLYLVNDIQSILTVFNAKTGTLAYQERLGEPVKEGFSSSPIAVGNTIFITNDEGQTFVIEAGPAFKLHRINSLNARVLATPALVDGTWYWRTDRELLAIGDRDRIR